MERYDIVIFGATGFTGNEVVLKLLKIMEESPSLKWAIAGRSLNKMKMLMENIKSVLGINISTVQLIMADVNNYSSLTDMTKYTKVLVNCVGPFTKYAEEVIKACIETKTHYLDISAEIYQIDVIAERYHEAAEEADVLIIPGCGFGSVPADMGVALLQKIFEGKLKYVKSYNQITVPRTAYIPGIHCLATATTWESLIYVLADHHNIAIKPTLTKDQNDTGFFHILNYKLWVPYPAPDEQLIKRSQDYLEKTNKIEPATCKSFYTFPWLIHALIFIPCFFLVYYLSGINWTRRLLLKYPRIFTFGYFSRKGPSAYVRKNTKFRFDMIGFGEDNENNKLKTLRIVVKGVDPGYSATAIILNTCAVTVVKEYYKMPRGGVISTAAAFYDTSLIENLQKNGITYEVSP